MKTQKEPAAPLNTSVFKVGDILIFYKSETSYHTAFLKGKKLLALLYETP